MKRYIPRLLKDHAMIEATPAYADLQEYVRAEDCRDAAASAFKTAYLHAVAVWCPEIDSDGVQRDMQEQLARYVSEHLPTSDGSQDK